MPSSTFVIVGAALAGAKAAETLRDQGFEGRVILVGHEEVRPYERPPLSKGYLRGEDSFDDAAVHSADWYQEHDVELLTGTLVTELDLSGQEVALSSGGRLHFDQLLLATGATPRKLAIPGTDLDGVHYLRTVAQASALKESLRSGTRVVVIGGGWIGAEVAASARQMGAEVALVEQAEVLLERVLGPEVGRIYTDLHREHGVELHLGVDVESILGNGAVSGVRLKDGTTLEAQVVVVGIGAKPRVELAEQAGLALGNGVAVDQHLRTSNPVVYAAGDVADTFYPRYGQRIRLEHWSAALNQGPLAARNMLGGAAVYDEIPYFFSDQYDLGMEYRGWAPKADRVVFRGDPASREFVAFWLQEGRVAAAMNANLWDVGDQLEALLKADKTVDPARLADPTVSLDDLA